MTDFANPKDNAAAPLLIPETAHRPLRRRDDGRRLTFVKYVTPLLRGSISIGKQAPMLQVSPELNSALLAAVVATSNDAIVTKNLEGTITSWNAAATRIFGYQPGEMIGESIKKIIPAELHTEEDDIISRLKRGERIEHFDTVRRTKDGGKIPVSLTISPLVDAKGQIVGASKIARDISERKQAEERQALLLNELRHRVKNTLSTVRAIANQTYAAPELRSRNATFSRRIAALAASCDLLVQDDWRGANLSDVVDAVLDPFRPNTQAIRVENDSDFTLTPRQANSIALALNELATNATKYGAWSQPEGYVLLRWEKLLDPQRTLSLEWIERGGPEVMPPRQTGFGTKLLNLALKHELNAETELRYEPEGFEFRMRF